MGRYAVYRLRSCSCPLCPGSYHARTKLIESEREEACQRLQKSGRWVRHQALTVVFPPTCPGSYHLSRVTRDFCGEKTSALTQYMAVDRVLVKIFTDS